MSFIYNALKKAEREGKVEGSWVPKPMEDPRFALSAIKLPSEVIREFALLKQNVQQAHAEQGTQMIAVTSSVPGEGCTTITYFLSLLLTQSINGFYSELSENHTTIKKRKNGILLIDSNFEKPVLHHLFDVTLSPGLIDFVYYTSSNNIFTKTVVANYLHLITAGNTDGNWHGIWNSDRLKKLFAKLKENFEYILIDAPPVIGHPETLALGKLTDGVLLVVKANETRLEVIEEAKQQLSNAGVKVLGVVLNERKFFIPEGIYRRL